MKKVLLILIALTSFFGNQATAGSTDKYELKQLLESDEAYNTLLDISLYFGDQQYSKVESTYGEVIIKKKAKRSKKSDQKSCGQAMIRALKTLQQRAISEGMNGVIDIKSYYNNRIFKSDSHFECGTGNGMARVVLKGTLVKF